MRRNDLDAVLQNAITSGAVPGVVALAGNAEGVLYEAAFGRRDLSAPAPMATDDVFWFASMTKAVTSVAAMQLVEQGRLALDAPIATVLPGFAAPQVLTGFTPDGTPQLRPAVGEITLRQLLTHTAGFGYDAWNADVGPATKALGLPRIPVTVDQHARMPLLFDPGTRWNYSIATDIVGQCVAAASDENFLDYLRDHIFLPLGMSDATFLLTPAQSARKARVHQRDGDGSLRPIDHETGTERSLSGGAGGGGMHGTARDYFRFLQMLLNGGTLDGATILRQETVADMGRNHIGDLNVQPLRSVMPARSNDADFFPGMAQKWGLGFLINPERSPSGRSPGGLCWAGLGNTYYWIDPTRGLAGVLLTQILPFADAKALDLLWAFERAVYAAVD